MSSCILSQFLLWYLFIKIFYYDTFLGVKLYYNEFNCTIVYKHPFYIFVKAWFGSDVGICSGTLVKSPFPLSLFMEMFLFFSGKETEFPIEPELTLELMMAANYLHTWIIISWAASPALDCKPSYIFSLRSHILVFFSRGYRKFNLLSLL